MLRFYLQTYFELRNDKRVYENTNLKIKRIMLKPFHNKEKSNRRFIKRLPLMFGDPICCPAVTFCQKNLNVKTLFANDMKCDIDWSAWEIVSKMDGRFVFVNKPLMGHVYMKNQQQQKLLKITIVQRKIMKSLKDFGCSYRKIIDKIVFEVRKK